MDLKGIQHGKPRRGVGGSEAGITWAVRQSQGADALQLRRGRKTQPPPPHPAPAPCPQPAGTPLDPRHDGTGGLRPSAGSAGAVPAVAPCSPRAPSCAARSPTHGRRRRAQVPSRSPPEAAASTPPPPPRSKSASLGPAEPRPPGDQIHPDREGARGQGAPSGGLPGGTESGRLNQHSH